MGLHQAEISRIPWNKTPVVSEKEIFSRAKKKKKKKKKKMLIRLVATGISSLELFLYLVFIIRNPPLEVAVVRCEAICLQEVADYESTFSLYLCLEIYGLRKDSNKFP